MNLIFEIYYYTRFSLKGFFKKLIRTLKGPFSIQNKKYRKIQIIIELLFILQVVLVVFTKIQDKYMVLMTGILVFIYYKFIDFQKGDWKYDLKKERLGRYLHLAQKKK